VIESYLAELARRLPPACRRRFLAETEAHLRDRTAALVAEGLEREEAETQAVTSFGPVEAVASTIAKAYSAHVTRRAAAVVLGALIVLVLPFYGIPKNTFGPAQWDAKPTAITVAQIVAGILWLGALGTAAGAMLVAFVDRFRVARLLVTSAVMLATASFAAAAVGAALWLDAAPWTPLWSMFGLMLPAAFGSLGLALAALAWLRAAALQ
jgi:HAAS domain-containing protein